MSERKTVAGAYAALEKHEGECALRYTQLNTTIGELKQGQRDHTKAAWAVALALIGWLAVQVWNGRNDAPRPVPVAASVAR